MKTRHRSAPGRATSVLAWGLLGLALVAMVIGQVLERVTGSLDGSLVEELALSIAFMAFPVVGALIASRHPRNAVGWMCLAIGLLVSLLVVATGYARYGLVLHPDRALPGTTVAAWVENWAWMPLVGTIPTMFFLLFPTGRPPSRRWKPVAWITGIFISVITLLSMLEDKLGASATENGDNYRLDNPIGIDGLGDIEQIDVLLLPLIPLVLVCASSLIFRYRGAPSDERHQLKWVASAATLFAAGMFLDDLLTLPSIMFPVLLSAVPASIGIAMLRHRLYEIDLIINRTLVYGALTAILAVVYLSLVVVLQQITSAVAPESDIAVAASTLAVAGLFRPLRSRIQSFIDRRFYRGKYDAARTLERFVQRLRDDVDLDSLTNDLVGVVRDTMHPAHASLWLRSGTEGVVDSRD